MRDISVPTNWNDYKFVSMTQKVLKIDVMVYNMTKNPKLHKKIFLVKVLEVKNSETENQQIPKITNVEKRRNVRKWRAIDFFCEISEN